MNFGSSIIGIIGGLIFYDLRERKVDIMKYMVGELLILFGTITNLIILMFRHSELYGTYIFQLEC